MTQDLSYMRDLELWYIIYVIIIGILPDCFLIPAMHEAIPLPAQVTCITLKQVTPSIPTAGSPPGYPPVCVRILVKSQLAGLSGEG